MSDFRYVNEKCPVCGELFKIEDDIVVCPLCGTPHHRECYKKSGECGNAERHSEGFIWKSERAVEPKAPEANAENTQSTPNAQVPPFGSAGQGAPGVPPFTQSVNPLSSFPPELSDGVPTADAAAVIQKNAPKYLAKFFTEESGHRTFNFAAFLFCGYWFLYRKMFKDGIIALVIALVIAVVPTFIPQYRVLSEKAEEITYEMSDLDLTAADADEKYAEITEKYTQCVRDYPLGVAVRVLAILAEFAHMLHCGLTANKKYKEHVINKVRQVNANAQTYDLSRYRLTKEGGSNIGFFFLAILAVSIIEKLFSLLAALIFK